MLLRFILYLKALKESNILFFQIIYVELRMEKAWGFLVYDPIKVAKTFG